MTLEQVRAAYSARADEYIEVLGNIEHADQRDRDYVHAWAKLIVGPIMDVGCGPGQWTHFLHQNGADIVGLDPVAAFVNDARFRYPAATYQVGRAEQLGSADGQLRGILAWYSLIHTDPETIEKPLAEFARCLKPEGSLLIGYFEGPAREPFDHAVTQAFHWSRAALTLHLESVGFTVESAEQRRNPGTRPHGALIARRAGA